MAKGRFVSKEICLDKKVNELSCADSMLGFTWLIPHLDREGRTYGDPAIVKSFIFPRRTDITVEMMAEYIQEWHDAGLIIWYEAKGDRYIQFPKFDKHQKGLRKDREPESVIPRYVASKNPQTSGKHPAEVNDKLSLSQLEEKGEVEVNDDNSPADLITTFTNYTKLKPGKDAEKIANEFITAGVISEDIIKAVDFLNGSDKYKCVRFASVEESAILEMNKRKAKGKSKSGYRSY